MGNQEELAIRRATSSAGKEVDELKNKFGARKETDMLNGSLADLDKGS